MGSFLLRKYFETFSVDADVPGLAVPLWFPLARSGPLGASRPLRIASAASTPNR